MNIFFLIYCFLYSMTRSYTRKSDRGKTPVDVIERAVELVIEENRSVRSVADEFNICHVTLLRYVRKKKSNPEDSLTVGFIRNRLVFSPQQEDAIEGYLKDCRWHLLWTCPNGVRNTTTEKAKSRNLDWHPRKRCHRRRRQEKKQKTKPKKTLSSRQPKKARKKRNKTSRKTMVTKKQMRKRMRGVWCALSFTPTVDLEKSGCNACSAKAGLMKNVLALDPR